MIRCRTPTRHINLLCWMCPKISSNIQWPYICSEESISCGTPVLEGSGHAWGDEPGREMAQTDGMSSCLLYFMESMTDLNKFASITWYVGVSTKYSPPYSCLCPICVYLFKYAKLTVLCICMYILVRLSWIWSELMSRYALLGRLLLPVDWLVQINTHYSKVVTCTCSVAHKG